MLDEQLLLNPIGPNVYFIRLRPRGGAVGPLLLLSHIQFLPLTLQMNTWSNGKPIASLLGGQGSIPQDIF